LMATLGAPPPAETPFVRSYLYKPLKPQQLFKALDTCFDEKPTTQHPETLRQNNRPGFDANLSRRHPLRILLVEDNPTNQRVAQMVLQRMGYRADIANHGKEALTALEQKTYDVLLMDVQMPEMDGLTATRCIRMRWKDEGPHIIAMTANAMASDREECLLAGMDDYLTKPIQINELVGALMRAPSPNANNQEADEQVTLRPEEKENNEALLQEIDKALAKNFNDFSSISLDRVISSYMNTAMKALHDLRRAIMERDALEVQTVGYKLHEESLQVGASRLTQLLFQLECAVDSGVMSDADGKMEEVEIEFQRVKIVMEILHRRHKAAV
ncbi:MAG: response regulator, partial [Pseudomonadota bacterium]